MSLFRHFIVFALKVLTVSVFSFFLPSEGNSCDAVFKGAAAAHALTPLRTITSVMWGVENFLTGGGHAATPLFYLNVLELKGYNFDGKRIADVHKGSSLFAALHNFCYQGDCATSAQVIHPESLTKSPLSERYLAMHPGRRKKEDNAFDLVVSIQQIEPSEDTLSELIRITKPRGQIKFTLPYTSSSMRRLAREILESMAEVEEFKIIDRAFSYFNGTLVAIKLNEK